MSPTTAQTLRDTLYSLREQWQQLQKEEAEHAEWEQRLNTRGALLSERIGDIVADLRDAGEPETDPT